MTCSCGKVAHGREEAHEVAEKARQIEGRRFRRNGKVVAYRCPTSDVWHTGHDRRLGGQKATRLR